MPLPSIAAPQLRSADPPGRGYTCLGNRLLDEWAQAEPHGVSEASARVAEACGVSRQFVTGWRNAGKRVPPKHWHAIASVTGIVADAWETWELLGRAEPEDAPPSGERVADEVEAPLGSTTDELWRSVRRLERIARSSSITPKQAADVEGKKVTALAAISRLERGQAIHEHPDADGFLEDVVQAVYDALGPDAPEGLGSQIAERLLELQTRRAEAPRKAAA